VSVTDSPPYDPDTAAAGLWLLRDAHDQWLADNTEVIGERAGPQPEHVELRLHQHAASVLTWTRALDDLCDGDPEPLLTYRSVRPPMAPLLHGARYACNRSVHQLLTLTRVHRVMRFPLTPSMIFNTYGTFRWVPEKLLPLPGSERPSQASSRAEYVATMAGQEIGPTLQQLRDWFEQQLT
jgi:hypothetical protein